VALVTRAMLKDVPLDPQIQQDAGTGVEALQRGAARGFLPVTALLNADEAFYLWRMRCLHYRKYRNSVFIFKLSQLSAGATTMSTIPKGAALYGGVDQQPGAS
jgi:hypothetical protein